MNLLQIPLIEENPEVATKTASLAADAAEWKSLSLQELINKLASTMVDFAIHLAIAIGVFYLGKFVIHRIYSFVTAILVRRHVDKSLSTFVLSLIKMTLYFILVVTVIGILGINTSSFIALFASAGVAIGMAMSGTLQNFAGGVLILLLKPYKVGDYIEAQGYAGTVTEIQIFSTIICTPDNKSIIIPNGGLSTSSINNWSREEYRRIDWTVSIAYGDDVELARREILSMLENDQRIVKSTLADDIETRTEEALQSHPEIAEPAPQRRSWLQKLLRRNRPAKKKITEADLQSISPLSSAKLNADRAPKVFLASLEASSVDLSIRAWVLSKEYWDVYFSFNELFYRELPKRGLNFPFPQLDVHLNAPQPSECTETAQKQ